MNKAKRRIAQFAAILVLTLCLLEFAGLFVFDNSYYWDLRYLTMSRGALVNQGGSAPDQPESLGTYRPNSTVRIVAAYADFLGASIEYDCTLDINALGFVHAGSVDRPVDYLVLGDSFTEGHGGCPWLTEEALSAQPELSHLNILNGAQQGSGVQGFEAVLKLHERAAGIKNLVIIAISNDFKRGPPTALPLNDRCYTSLECDGGDYWHFMDMGASHSDLLLEAERRRVARGTDLDNELNRRFFTLRVFSQLTETFSDAGASPADALMSDDAQQALYAANFAALQRILGKYPDTAILLVPQRDEVGLLGRENADTTTVKNFFADNGIRYETCALSPGDYMPTDGHPNKRGYSKLLRCLKDSILSQELRRSIGSREATKPRNTGDDALFRR